jgi:molybdopterin synthase catalytic subunit
VLEAAQERFGADFGRVLDSSAMWVNGEPASEADTVADGDEVAVLPPVSGGSGPPPEDDDWIEVTDAAIDLGSLHAWAVTPAAGATVVFTGTARETSDGRSSIVALEYEAYEPYASRRMHEVAASARRRLPALERIAIVHRVGRLEVTQLAVAVVVSAPHREEAFAAARWCIDETKATAPIWKRELWAGGGAWVACEHDPVDITTPDR